MLNLGYEVLCVDNFHTGVKQNIIHLLDNSYFEVIRRDVCFPLYVEVDEIYNLACPASPIHYQFDPVQTIKTSVYGAINMLGLTKRIKAKILQASTSKVYSEGSQTRSFCYVDDLIDGFVRMMNSKQGLTGPVNMGNPDEFTILELAEKVIDITGSRSKIIHKPLPTR